MRKEYFVSFFGGAVVFVLLLLFFSRLVEPKYATEAREGNLISEYYREAERESGQDVIFIGDCEAYSTFVPPVIYEKYGITSFVRGSPSQSMAQSYYLLCETLKYEKPKAVVFSVYAVCKGGVSSEAYNRLTLDGMRLSSEKIYAVRECVGENESIASYFLPLLRFHSRIFELKGEDLEYYFSRPQVSHNGYYMQKGSSAVLSDAVEETFCEPILQENFDWLDKMREKCRECGVELILVKTPISSWRYPWYGEWNEQICGYAEKNGISYYNLTDHEKEIGIELPSDSYDGGIHLNVYGAEKVSIFFGKLLAERHGILGDESDEWDEKVRYYYKERNDE